MAGLLRCDDRGGAADLGHGPAFDERKAKALLERQVMPRMHARPETEFDAGMGILGHGRQLYHRQVQRAVARAGFPVEDIRVSGPIARDPDCRDRHVPARQVARKDGVLHADGTVKLLITADADFADPGTHRKDQLHAEWDVTLVLGPACTIDMTADPAYDPSGAAANEATGTTGADVICGGPGRDDITGGGGNDRLYGAGGRDSLSGRGFLSGGPDRDIIDGSDVADSISGGGGDDEIFPHGGNDVVDAGNGNDDVIEPSTGSRNDRVVGGTGDDLLDLGGGADHAFGQAGRDKLRGGAGPDVLVGGADNDVLVGGGGRDNLSGGGGDDTLRAFDGLVDEVDCGAGSRDTAYVDHADHTVVRTCEVRRFHA